MMNTMSNYPRSRSNGLLISMLTFLLCVTPVLAGDDLSINVLPADMVFAYTGVFPAKVNYKLSIPVKNRDRLRANPQLQLRVFFTDPADLIDRASRSQPDPSGCVPFASWVTPLNLYEVENFVVLLESLPALWLQVQNNKLVNRQISIIVEETSGQREPFSHLERVRIRQDKAGEYFRAAFTVDIGGIGELSAAAYRRVIEQLKSRTSPVDIAVVFCITGITRVQADAGVLIASVADCQSREQPSAALFPG
jgi:hypothetical protein